MKIKGILFLLLASRFLISQSLTVKGRIIDQSDNSGIEYASVTLHSPADSTLLYGLVTDENGEFEFTKIKESSLYLSAQFLGYEAYQSNVFQPQIITDLGSITLSIGAETLSEIQVTGRAITNLHRLDKQVYDAGQFQNAKGGTASDILSNLPSVSINSFGEIAVRGATGFLVMINGKPVQTDPAILLQQLSANAIEDIEIITAPSAKYDPDGNAGIINIKTKKGTTDGLYIIANALIGLPSIEPYDNANSTPRYGGDLTLNFKKDKWDISAGLDYRRYDISGRREGYVNTYLDEVLTEFPSDGERSFDEKTYTARITTSYTPNDRQSLSAAIYAGKRTKERTADILYNNQQRVIIPSSQFQGTESYYDLYQQTNQVFTEGTALSNFTYFNENLRVRKGDFFIGALDYQLDLTKSSSLKLSGLYERTILGGPTDNANLAYPNTSEILQLQFNDNDNPLDGFRFQADFEKQFGDHTWESGYQYRYLKHPGDFIYLDRDLINQVWQENPLFTNRIELKRKIHSLYSQLSGSSNNWKYSAGVRLEYFDRSVSIARPNATFLLDKFNLFPSFNISYDLQNGWLAKAGYSKRIARTTTFKMTPFPEREHSETLEQGDAELLPEYIDVVEAGIVKTMGDNTVFANAYYRNVQNVINRVNTVFNDTILNRIYTNVGTATVLGVEIGTTVYPAKWWKLYLGTNIYQYKIKGSLFGDAIETKNTIYSINANTNFTFNHSLQLQLALNYLSERVTAQGRDSRFYNPSLTLRKTFSDKRFAVALQWLNIDLGILSSNEQRITTVRNNFYTTTNYVYEVDIVQLNFTYQLNQASQKTKLIESEFGKKEF